MGLDPEHPDYEPGVQCVLCKDLLFDGVTPKYVEADISGIERCPIAIGPTPDGTFLLTQSAACRWQYLSPDDIAFIWELNPGTSIFSILRLGFIWFRSNVPDNCIDAFVNQNVCGVGPVYGENGYALCYWGPTIGP